MVTEMLNAPSVVGIDGCPKGWCCVELSLDDGCETWHAEVLDDIHAVWRRFGHAQLILIDIPIGLWDAGTQQRRCEAEARRWLGRRRSSVFTPPLRSSLRFETYARASAHNYRLSGRKLSIQAWGITSKIAEVDRFLTAEPAARGILREAHPEILFSVLNGDEPMAFTKKDPRGARERRTLLSNRCPYVNEIHAAVRKGHRKRDVADDDICDALVESVCAQHIARGAGAATLPAQPGVDSRCLPMEMVFPVL